MLAGVNDADDDADDYYLDAEYLHPDRRGAGADGDDAARCGSGSRWPQAATSKQRIGRLGLGFSQSGSSKAADDMVRRFACTQPSPVFLEARTRLAP